MQYRATAHGQDELRGKLASRRIDQLLRMVVLTINSVQWRKQPCAATSCPRCRGSQFRRIARGSAAAPTIRGATGRSGPSYAQVWLASADCRIRGCWRRLAEGSCFPRPESLCPHSSRVFSPLVFCCLPHWLCALPSRARRSAYRSARKAQRMRELENPTSAATLQYGTNGRHSWIGHRPEDPPRQLRYREFIGVVADYVTPRA